MAGFWRLNAENSDDPRQRLQALRRAGGGVAGAEKDEALLNLIQAANSLTIVLKDRQIDLTNDRGNMLSFYTGGGKIQKSTDANVQVISAHWKGSHLISDEKTPEGRKMTRTLELSPTGQQLFEIWHIEMGPSETALVVWYSYDPATESTQ